MDIEKILYTYEDDYNPSSMVPEPRNMNQGGRARFENGEIVQPSASMMVDTTTSDTVAKGLAKKLLNYQEASKGVDNQTKQYLMNLFQKDLDNTGYTVEEVMRYMPQNMSEGGQLVSPSVDGSRPGYNGKKKKKLTPAQEFNPNKMVEATGSTIEEFNKATEHFTKKKEKMVWIRGKRKWKFKKKNY